MKTNIPLKIKSLGEDGFHIWCEILVNELTFDVVLDTGASRSVFDKGMLSKVLKLRMKHLKDKVSTGIGNEVTNNYHTRFKKLALGSFEIEQYEAVVIDFKHINEMYKQLGFTPVLGILGCDILMKFNAIIDLKKLVLKLNKE